MQENSTVSLSVALFIITGMLAWKQSAFSHAILIVTGSCLFFLHSGLLAVILIWYGFKTDFALFVLFNVTSCFVYLFVFLPKRLREAKTNERNDLHEYYGKQLGLTLNETQELVDLFDGIPVDYFFRVHEQFYSSHERHNESPEEEAFRFRLAVREAINALKGQSLPRRKSPRKRVHQ